MGICDQRARVLGCRELKKISLAVLGFLALSLLDAAAAERKWDQARAKKMVAKVLEVEKRKNRPWNRIPWRTNVSNAVQESKKTGKPIFVFFFVEQNGPPLEGCGLEGRLLRAHSLADSTVLSLIKSKCIPVKLKLDKKKPFPVDWPALGKWAAAFKFSNGRGFAGCSVVSFDLQIEYGNSGSARLFEVLDSSAFDPKRFAAMMERSASRLTEERSLRVQRGVTEYERKVELYRFRKGVTRAVQSESRSQLPPKGYSLEQALELYQIAGAVPKK